MSYKENKAPSGWIYSAGAGKFLAPYACIPEKSRGRKHKEAGSPGRSVFQRDRDRIIHSTAFRRLEYKTQVFVFHEGDHYRTRLTHSLEVAQLSRSVSRELGLDEDLAESIALAHDLGHTPFGHAGEDALCDVMSKFGGFDHNAQTIRIMTSLENKYADFDGLNLTWECLEGVAKHNGPLEVVSDEWLVMSKNKKKHSSPITQHSSIPRALAEYNKQHDLELHTYPSMEAQVSALCDDIAYNNHDIEDGLRANLFTIKDLLDLPMVGEAFQDISAKHKKLEVPRLIHEAKRRLTNKMVRDMVEETQKSITRHKVKSANEVRNLGKNIVSHSKQMAADNKILKEFLNENMYRHYKVNRMTSKARRVISELFEFFHNEPECLPTEWRNKVKGANKQKAAEIVADFIAGMTDRFAFEEHRRIFDTSYKLIGGN